LPEVVAKYENVCTIIETPLCSDKNHSTKNFDFQLNKQAAAMEI
jgi:hypothetical protein